MKDVHVSVSRSGWQSQVLYFLRGLLVYISTLEYKMYVSSRFQSPRKSRLVNHTNSGVCMGFLRIHEDKLNYT